MDKVKLRLGHLDITHNEQWHADFDAHGKFLSLYLPPGMIGPKKAACLCCGKDALQMPWGYTPHNSVDIPASVCLFVSKGDAWIFIHE